MAPLLRLLEGMKLVMRSTDPVALSFAKAMLQAEGIQVFEMDVNMSVLEGSIGILPRRLMVADGDHFVARAVLRDHQVDGVE